MTVTDDRYEEILKAFESDHEFDVPKVAAKRTSSTEDWMDDGITLKELMKARDEDKAGVVAQNFVPEHHAVEDYDVLSLKDLLQIQKEEEGIMAKKFNGKNESYQANEKSIAQAARNAGVSLARAQKVADMNGMDLQQVVDAGNLEEMLEDQSQDDDFYSFDTEAKASEGIYEEYIDKFGDNQSLGGGFGQALRENDLELAFSRADTDNYNKLIELGYTWDDISKVIDEGESTRDPEEEADMIEDFKSIKAKPYGESEKEIEISDKDNTDKIYDKLIESFEDSTMENQNQGFKSDSDGYGVADLNADRKGNNISNDTTKCRIKRF